MRILGIDPSLQSTGFGVIEYVENQYLPIVYGIIRPTHGVPFHEKLNEIRTELEKIIAEFSPDEVAIENPFYAQNIKTAIALGQVRGAVLVAVAARGLDLFEYSALEIKKAVTGYGQADKNQVQVMVRTLLSLDDDALKSDAADALAAAICHLNASLFHKKFDA